MQSYKYLENLVLAIDNLSILSYTVITIHDNSNTKTGALQFAKYLKFRAIAIPFRGNAHIKDVIFVKKDVCNMDCFNCIHPDCINDAMEAADYRESRALERDYISPKSRKEKQIADQKRARQEANKEKIAARSRAYYAANKEQILAQQHAYYAANKEMVNARSREYYKGHKEHLAERARERREADPEAYLARQRAYYEAHREQIAAKNRAYYETHRERIATQNRAYYLRKKAERQRLAGSSDLPTR